MNLEQLIAASRAAGQAKIANQKLAIEQGLQSSLGELTSEAAEIAPAYDKLMKESRSAYDLGLGTARESAATRGVYRSGILTNKELALGQSFAEQQTQYGGERTRKLQDIARRRSLMTKQAQDKIAGLTAEGTADIEATIADMRYKDYSAREERAAAERLANINANANKEKDLTAEQFAVSALQELQPDRKSGKAWSELAGQIEALYPGSTKTGSSIDKLLNSYFTYGKGAVTQHQGSGSGILSGLINAWKTGRKSMSNQNKKALSFLSNYAKKWATRGFSK